MAHGQVADYGLYLPTDGHQSLFSSFFLLVQYLVKYIELCADRWCSAFVKSHREHSYHCVCANPLLKDVAALRECIPHNSNL